VAPGRGRVLGLSAEPDEGLSSVVRRRCASHHEMYGRGQWLQPDL